MNFHITHLLGVGFEVFNFRDVVVMQRQHPGFQMIIRLQCSAKLADTITRSGFVMFPE
jgi:hypothetical protein